jgi:hypothetical protein
MTTNGQGWYEYVLSLISMTATNFGLALFFLYMGAIL